ncbi:MAG: EscU/YscU/HrcU family type III secretion system export apparatus switch protein, partial [Planctomycetaceae bacterium]|nr:EscU/YscU/HrcU family type III secretion system export apparatus switch protein [Planctomycetaceae bacterium]
LMVETEQGEIARILNGSLTMFIVLTPLVLLFLVIAFASMVLQVGWHISPKAFELNFGKMDPIKGMKKVLGMRGLMKLLTGMAKIAVVSAILLVVISAEMPRIMNFFGLFDYQNNTSGPIVVYILDMLCWIGIYAGATLTALAVVDYAYQRWQHNEDIKMSKHEVKEEMRNMEGDPQIKRKRLERARSMAQKRMEQQVPDADVVVTNPTHYSCALRYRDKDPAPRLLAKGTDRMALRIREIASQHGVPIVEKPELARAIYRWVEVDEFVPESYWKAVAEVLAYVYQLDEAKKKRALGNETALKS